jgi:hypothetical protein
MADRSGCKTSSITNSNIQLSAKPSDICCICEELKSELHKPQLEISYEKVIQVLCEELCNVVLRTDWEVVLIKFYKVGYCIFSTKVDHEIL